MLTARLSHQWLKFDTQTSGVSAADFGFAKQVVLLGFTYAYSPRGDFFRSGAFWEGPAGASRLLSQERANLDQEEWIQRNEHAHIVSGGLLASGC
jgi:hypothetical protein